MAAVQVKAYPELLLPQDTDFHSLFQNPAPLHPTLPSPSSVQFVSPYKVLL